MVLIVASPLLSIYTGAIILPPLRMKLFGPYYGFTDVLPSFRDLIYCCPYVRR